MCIYCTYSTLPSAGILRHQQRGLTAVELVVALTVFALITSTATSLLHQHLSRRKLRLVALEVRSAMITAQRLAYTQEQSCALHFTPQAMKPDGCGERIAPQQLPDEMLTNARFGSGGTSSAAFIAYPSAAVSPGRVTVSIPRNSSLSRDRSSCSIHSSIRGAIRESC